MHCGKWCLRLRMVNGMLCLSSSEWLTCSMICDPEPKHNTGAQHALGDLVCESCWPLSPLRHGNITDPISQTTCATAVLFLSTMVCASMSPGKPGKSLLFLSHDSRALLDNAGLGLYLGGQNGLGAFFWKAIWQRCRRSRGLSWTCKVCWQAGL